MHPATFNKTLLKPWDDYFEATLLKIISKKKCRFVKG
jgi:hypothetical protein